MKERWDESLPLVVGLLAAGLPASEAWERAGLHPPEPPWESTLARAVGAAHALAGRLGAPLGAMLAALGDVAADQREAELAREVALAGPRLSARVLGWLPLLGVGLGAIIEPATLRLLTTSPVGWLLMAAGAALTVAGQRWTRRMVTAASRAGEGADLQEALAAALLAAALDSGVEVPRALAEVGAALGAEDLDAWAGELRAGVWSPSPPRWRSIGDAIRPAWEAGARAGPALAAARRSAARKARAQAAVAAGELGVRVAMPLTLCLLPAFTAVGIVPLLLAVVSGSGLVGP